MKLAITGGHLTPALALLPHLKKHSLLFIIRKHTYEGDSGPSFEYETIKTLGIPFTILTAARLQRKFTVYTIPSILKFPIAFFQSLRILIQFRPDVVFSFGGYVALPVCLAAFLLRIPIVTHEQTASNAGLANRIIGMFAQKVCVAFKEALEYFPKDKVVLTGNPVREELFSPPTNSPFLTLAKKPLIYITGGSGGSHDINMFISSILERLLVDYTVIHQVGSVEIFHDWEVLLEKKKNLPKLLAQRYIPRKHFSAHELAWIYRNAHLLVGRSGANTVYEILTFGIPSLLIPLVVGANKEQEGNARLVEKVGLGKVLPQEDLSTEQLLKAISEMVVQNDRYKRNASLAKKHVVLDAKERILTVLSEVTKT